jgi:hypothetical protein
LAVVEARRGQKEFQMLTWLSGSVCPLAIVCVILLVPCTPSVPDATAASYVDKTFTELVDEAEQIVVGRVGGQAARRVSSRLIVTDVAIVPLEILKGDVPNGPMTLTMLGGTVGSDTLKVSAFPALETGRTYVLFVKENGRSVLPLVGGVHGLFAIRWGVDGRPMVFDAGNQGVDAGFLVGVRPDRTHPSPPIALDDFVAAITARLAQ